MNVIISEPDKQWASAINSEMLKHSYKSRIVQDGNDCQLSIGKDIPEVVILDLETKNSSSLEVLKYLKMNYSQIKIVFTVTSEEKLKELNLDVDSLKSLGVSDVLIKPFQIAKLIDCISNNNVVTKRLVVVQKENILNEKDEDFTYIQINDFCSGNHAIFDHYIKLAKDKYVKIIHKGDRLDESRLQYYIEEKKIEHLYFKIKDRITYIAYANEILSRSLKISTSDLLKNFNLTKSVSNHYVDEIYTKGLSLPLVKEGMKICENMYEMIKSDSNLSKILKDYEDNNPGSNCHLFLTSFFAVTICTKLEWNSPRTIETIATASFLHDIGKLKMPLELRNKRPEAMTESEYQIYEDHPRLGYEILDSTGLVTEAVKQIVFQHHETCDGKGFPNSLFSHQIYPMAKIVSLANHFAEILVQEKLTPLIGLKKMVSREDFTRKYDTEIIKALFSVFMKEKAK